MPLVVGGPLVIAGGIIYTWWLIGPFCFIGVATFSVTYLIQVCFILYKINFINLCIVALCVKHDSVFLRKKKHNLYISFLSESDILGM